MAELDTALPERINVVGNARSLLNSDYGALIDSAPTIRFNHAQIINPGKQGERLDFVASSVPDVLDRIKRGQGEYHTLIFTPYYDIHMGQIGDWHGETRLLIFPIQLSINLMHHLRARPTTGAMILWLLDSLNRTNVSIFGFDWKKTPTFYHQGASKDPHNHVREEALMTDLINRNGWSLHR